MLVRAVSADGSSVENEFNIIISDVDEVVPVSAIEDNNTAENTVDENSAIGTAVGITATATAGQDDKVTYSLLDDAGGRFAIDPETGEITVAGPLDYEAYESHTVRVLATASNGTTSEEEFTVTVSDLDEIVPVSSVVDSNAGDNAVEENSAVGTTVGITATATAGPDDKVTYSLIDDAGGRFAIDPETGEVSVAGKLDYETADSHTVRVLATASNGTTSEEEFTVAVSDLDEIVPVSSVVDSNVGDNAVDENSAIGTRVGITASAVAGQDDSVIYSLVDDAEGRFAIDPKTGEISTAAVLDYEAAGSHTVRVQATASNGTVSEETFTVAINDVNEAPTLLVNGQKVSVTETFENGSTGWSDNTTTDGGENVGTFLGRFGNGGAVEKTFDIDPGAQKAVIEFDLYEIDSWDGENFRIEVMGQQIDISLNWKGGAETESGESGNVSWSLVTQETDDVLIGQKGRRWFDNDQIHKVRLEITEPESSLTLKLSDTLNQSVADESWGIDNLSVQGVDASGNPVTVSITEGISGATVASLSVSDPDSVGAVSYTVDDDRFEVVDGTLKLKADQSLDYETERSVTVTVTVTDEEGLTDQQILNIGVIDVDEVIPVESIADINAADNSVDENSAPGTAVGITAQANAGSGGKVTYSLTDDADGRFAIDSETGEVTVAGELNYETANSHTITVQATGSNGTSSEEDFTIAVNDVNEAPTLIVGMEGLRNTGVETFENGTPNTWWTNEAITDGGANFSNFLGRYGNQEVGTVLDVVRGADKAVIEFDLYEIDSWDNENFTVQVQGEEIEIPLSGRRDDESSSGVQGDVSWSLVTQAPGADLGFSSKWTKDQIHKVRLEVKNPGGVLLMDAPAYLDYLDLTFGSTLDESIENESWGIDNLSVQSQDSAGNPLTMAVLEGLPGYQIAALGVSDPDTSGNVTYSVDDDRFEVVNGVLKLKSDQALSYEEDPSVTLTVTVTDEGGLSDQQTLSFGVMTEEHITGVSPVDNVTDTNSADNSVDENSALGTTVGITAQANPGTSTEVTYALTDDAEGRFAIDAQTGEVTVAGELDYEAASSHTISVLATGNNGTSSEENFTIAVNDVNEAPTLLVNGQKVSVTETFENGSTGWSDNTTTDGGENVGTFLGRFGSGGAVEKTFDIDPGAEKAVIEFDLYEIDSWDGENFRIEVMGQQIDISLNWKGELKQNLASLGM
ncbi:cadherin repeat domain-containing protein [Aliamphritea spongicola]|nr:cadherin repeat domain-containing protein [Aliamphritea spongicola]